VDYAQWRSWYRTVMLEQPASVAVVAPGRWETLPSGQEVDSAAALQENEAYYSIP
jgi:hypothetical protein